MKPKNITRLFREKELLKVFSSLPPGIVLDVGAKNNPYVHFIPHKKYYSLDIDSKNKPDYCVDIHRTNLPGERFDIVIATEVLEHLYNPQRAINEIYRLLKPKGVCIISTPAFYHYHPDPFDYFRFTYDSLSLLFQKFENVEIKSHGNRVHIIWQIFLDTFPWLNFLTPVFIKYNRTDITYPLGFVVIARK